MLISLQAISGSMTKSIAARFTTGSLEVKKQVGVWALAPRKNRLRDKKSYSISLVLNSMT
jgi:hypothetical protein